MDLLTPKSSWRDDSFTNVRLGIDLATVFQWKMQILKMELLHSLGKQEDLLLRKKTSKNMGLRRLMKTPKEKMSPAVEDHFGTKRLMQTPKEKKVSSPAVKEHFGTQKAYENAS